MILSRRASLMLGIAALGATVLPSLAMAQAETQSSFSFPVDGGDVIFHPVDHASMVIETPGGVIYVDPVGGAEAYAGKPQPSLILITHEHGDHYDLPTLEALPPVAIIANPAVHSMLPAEMQSRSTAMANGDEGETMGMRIEAVPAYNITPDRLQYHPQGRDNGYVLTIGGKRFYIAGDTEDTPEMRALEGIEVAFLPMNLPYTMTIEQAADAVAAFRPVTVFPYHHRDSDVQEFAGLVEASDAGSLVILANWYPTGAAG
ncbi:MBL fold metallo-hydrolase [Paracoccus subflavus]|uniref:MBL fold metallo-hydrolase n=1 Tax=Paracoccus subflavus TaxID=2528244 RepID=A0A4Q9GA58_9RHOB|nr:MBL fold metallo-hydrolase [Paracoccus subflavus]TBN42599.1 MBL fold metallo-hydrolase [Paracoccus subflavus]